MAADQPINHPQVYPFSCGNWPASDGGRSADQSSAGVPALLWELACQRRRPISRSIIRRCTRSPVGAGLPAMAADQPINHPQVYPLSCGSWPASDGGRSADQSSAGVPVLLWELARRGAASQRRRPDSRPITHRCTPSLHNQTRTTVNFAAVSPPSRSRECTRSAVAGTQTRWLMRHLRRSIRYRPCPVSRLGNRS